MSKESFLYRETQPVFDLLEESSQRSGVSRGQAFEDFLHMSLCALSGGQMEDEYLATVQKHTAGSPGKRGCDSIARAFGQLIDAMEKTQKDILGDLFQGGITYGEAGQYLTPEPVCDVMARMTLEGASPDSTARKSVFDPCCGSGRLLLAAAQLQPHWEFVGQDIDLRCVRMTAINLALRNRYGHIIWGNSLRDEQKLVYRTGFNLQGFVRPVSLGECAQKIQQEVRSDNRPETAAPSDEPTLPVVSTERAPRKQQLHLF